MPADDLTDPGVATAFAHLDTSIGALPKNSAVLLPALLRSRKIYGMPGRHVPLDQTIQGFDEIINGEHDKLPEQAFYMVGNIAEAIEKASKL